MIHPVREAPLRRVPFPQLLVRRAAVAAAILVGLAVAVPAAHADDAAAIDNVTKLNKRALEEYENLNFDKAKKTLTEALELCTKNSLDNHPIKARTYIHMGVVVLGGSTTERDEAIKQFQKALAIQPEIKLTSQVANPEVQSAFDEAVKTAPPAPPEAQDEPGGKTGPGSSSGPPDVPPAGATEGLSHDAVTSGTQERAIPISVMTAASLGAKKVVLVFKPEGGSEFLQVELKEYSAGNWSGSIPESATEGGWVAYALSVLDEGGQVVATQGSPEAPMVIRLKPEAKVAGDHHDDEEQEPEAPAVEPKTWFFGLGLGTGVGYAKGFGDQNVNDTVTSGFGPSKLGHLLPELGYFVAPDMVLSLQIRLQFVSGATSIVDVSKTMCGADHICDPATMAVAGLARMTWLFGSGAFVPYLSLVLGAGQIRHLATFPNNNRCGPDPVNKPMKCVDTVAAGPILVGPAAGFFINATPTFGVTLGVTPLLGFPSFTFHLDFNGGIVIRI